MADPRRGVAVEICDATKTYAGKTALDGVSLVVEPGSFCVLLGPSGSGKTTLLRAIAGIERLDSGQITIGGRTVAMDRLHRPPEQRDLAMVFQDYALWPHMTVLDNVAFPLSRRHLGRNEVKRQAAQMLHRVGLADKAMAYPAELSGGSQQRVALARSLVCRSPLILFDEPLSNLDADLREHLRIEIATMTRKSGATSIYITHDQSEAFALADKVGVLREGRLVQFGTPEEIYRTPADAFAARFTGLSGELDAFVHGPGPLGTNTAKVRPKRARHGTPPLEATALGALPQSGDATLLLRPSALRLTAPGHPDAHLDATVVDVAYRGRGYDHAIALADGSPLVGIHDERRWERGSSAGVRILGEGCMVAPSQREPGVPPAALVAGDSVPDHPRAHLRLRVRASSPGRH